MRTDGRSKVIKFVHFPVLKMSEAQLFYLAERLRDLESRSKTSGNHVMFIPRPGKTGSARFASDNGRGYVTVKLSIPGLKPKSLLVARAAYICRTARLDLYPGNGMDDWHVSHTCHRRLCIKAEHLVLEPGFVNKGRNSCSPTDGCSQNHSGYPPCDLED